MDIVNSPVSKCCKALMRLAGDSDEGTRYYLCTKCGKACDIYVENKPISEEECNGKCRYVGDTCLTHLFQLINPYRVNEDKQCKHTNLVGDASEINCPDCGEKFIKADSIEDKEDWEKEFDGKFRQLWREMPFEKSNAFVTCKEEVKDFIRQLLADQKQRILQRFEEVINENRDPSNGAYYDKDLRKDIVEFYEELKLESLAQKEV